jgi:hypothetical protein
MHDEQRLALVGHRRAAARNPFEQGELELDFNEPVQAGSARGQVRCTREDSAVVSLPRRSQQHMRLVPPGMSGVDSILGIRSAGLRPQCPIIGVAIRHSS